MLLKLVCVIAAISVTSSARPAEDTTQPTPTLQVALTIAAGVPLRLYLVKRLRMRIGEPVEARLIDPVYAFDRIVVPGGAELQGHVVKLDPVAKMTRLQAILNGDFSPLHFARVEFTNITLPDGHSMAIHTVDAEGLPTLYSPPHQSKKKPNNQAANGGVLGTAKQQAQQQVQQQLSARSHGLLDLVRGPNKGERLEDFLIAKLPYHPQWYRRNTRFDAVLKDPLDFGSVPVTADALQSVAMPVGEAWGQVRLITEVSSADADTNTRVLGVLSQPVFSPSRKLVLPEGTELSGRVRLAQKARWFHRGGQLRFTFDHIEPPAFLAVHPISTERVPVLLSAAESDPRAHVKIDSEGDAKATEPKSRLLAPMLALIVANRAADNDAGRTAGSAGATSNYGGRTLGGFSGFGLLGTAAAQGSKTLGAVLGYYGLGWTVYSTIVSRGSEVEFKKNTAINVRFGASPNPLNKPASHFMAAGNTLP
jgi:hypothetical protein